MKRRTHEQLRADIEERLSSAPAWGVSAANLARGMRVSSGVVRDRLRELQQAGRVERLQDAYWVAVPAPAEVPDAVE